MAGLALRRDGIRGYETNVGDEVGLGLRRPQLAIVAERSDVAI